MPQLSLTLQYRLMWFIFVLLMQWAFSLIIWYWNMTSRTKRFENSFGSELTGMTPNLWKFYSAVNILWTNLMVLPAITSYFLVNIYGFFMEFLLNILIVCWWISVLLFTCTKRTSGMDNFVIWFGKAAHDPRIILHIFLLPHPFITEKEKILSYYLLDGTSFFIYYM